jgi:uncharacterized protein (TIGR03435 family)
VSQLGRITLPILLVCLSFAQAHAQSPKRFEFEVASIRPTPSIDDQGGKVNLGVHIDGAQVRFVSFSLRDYLARAYGTNTAMVFGPDWTASERFDISATLPAGATPNQFPEMLQALLADRFQLKFHKEKKELPAYALLTGKGPLKLKESPPDSDADQDEPKGNATLAATGSAAGVGVNFGHGSSYSLANNRFEVRKLTMTQIATYMERFADHPIVDMTGLSGKYDFTINLTEEDYQAMLMRAAISVGASLPPEAIRMLAANSSGAGLSDALQQVGLRLDSRKAPLDVLVIDDALKTPTAN